MNRSTYLHRPKHCSLCAVRRSQTLKATPLSVDARVCRWPRWQCRHRPSGTVTCTCTSSPLPAKASTLCQPPSLWFCGVASQDLRCNSGTSSPGWYPDPQNFSPGRASSVAHTGTGLPRGCHSPLRRESLRKLHGTPWLQLLLGAGKMRS